MDTKSITLRPLENKKVAILGYGNQGRAHALNLRDSGVDTSVFSREGESLEQARKDGFEPRPLKETVEQSDVLLFLFPDQVIPTVYHSVEALLKKGRKTIGFAHGFAYHFGYISVLPECGYFLVGPKGAGSILREQYEAGKTLPGVFALGKGASTETREICLAYAKAIGVGGDCLLETTFQEETETDLFGEQAVLCGGLPALIEAAFNSAVAKGTSPEMAFFECCYEAKLILDLLLKYGPKGMASRISPTAFYGGMQAGRLLVDDTTKGKINSILKRIQNAEFAKEWMSEVEEGQPRAREEKHRIGESLLEKTFQKLKATGAF